MRISHQQVTGLGGAGGAVSGDHVFIIMFRALGSVSINAKKFKIKFSSFDSDMIMQENPSNSLKVPVKLRKGATSCLSRVWNTGRQ